MAKTRGAAAAATGTVVHGDPETGKEAVSSVEMPGAARAMETLPATRKSVEINTYNCAINNVRYEDDMDGLYTRNYAIKV